MDRVTLRNLRFFLPVGYTPEERRVGQHLELDVEFHLDLREAGQSDRIGATINYAEAYARVADALRELEVQLLETVAERAAQAVQGLGAQRVVVRVRKRSPPIPGALADCAEVEIVR